MYSTLFTALKIQGEQISVGKILCDFVSKKELFSFIHFSF